MEMRSSVVLMMITEGALTRDEDGGDQGDTDDDDADSRTPAPWIDRCALSNRLLLRGTPLAARMT